MQFNLPYSWLKEYIAVPSDPQKLANELSLYGATVEKIQAVSHNFSDVYVGEILQIEKHPDADKLQIATVNVGKGHRVIVCGAPNIKVGQKVPVAVPGSVLPGDFRITKREVRGIVSDGMLCSAKELAFGDDHAGILILPHDTPVGKKLVELGVEKDTLLEIEPTTNRPDLASVIGIARELSAITGKDVKPVKLKKLPTTKTNEVTVNILEKKLCRRFVALLIKDVVVQPSPWWLQERLVRVGIRPINNIVDITNYVMLELGQPMHVFDADKVGYKLNVRLAKKNETLLALDGKTYELNKEALIITDKQDKPASIAGIMGGEQSGVTEQTTNIILEVASWDKVSVRRTARSMQLYSEAQKLFEKGLSSEAPRIVIERAAALVSELAGGEIVGEPVDKFYEKRKAVVIDFSLEEIQRHLGVSIPAKQVTILLQRLGFLVKSSGKKMNITVPYWRENDVRESIDIVEEVARLYGYHKFETVLPEATFVRGDFSFDKEYELKNKLRSLGFTETYSYSLVPEKWISLLNQDFENAIKVLNPLSKDLLYMRPSLIPSLIEVLDKNQGYFDDIRIFEMAMTYEKGSKGKTVDDFRQESLILAGVIMNPSLDDETLFREAKGSIEELLANNIEWVRGDETSLYDTHTMAHVNINGQLVGKIGLIKQSVTKALGISSAVVGFELQVPQIINFVGMRGLQDIPKYPSAKRDLSLVVDKSVRYTEIESAIIKASNLVDSVELFDIYRSEELGKNKQSFALHISFSHPDRTLEASEIDAALEKINSALSRQVSAEVR